jgi:hypothetical protein
LNLQPPDPKSYVPYFIESHNSDSIKHFNEKEEMLI